MMVLAHAVATAVDQRPVHQNREEVAAATVKTSRVLVAEQ